MDMSVDILEYKLIPVDAEASYWFQTVLQLWCTRPDHFLPHGLPLVDVIDIPFASRFIGMSKQLLPEDFKSLGIDISQLDPDKNYAILKKKV